jgi:KUP system potassium uptake protein
MAQTVLGVLSLILWALLVTVTLKYVVILLRADNKGEGGTERTDSAGVITASP